MKLITLHLPVPYIQMIDNLVKQDFAPNRAEAIRLLIRDGLHRKNAWKRVEVSSDASPELMSLLEK